MPEIMPSVKSVAKLWTSGSVGFDLWALELFWKERINKSCKMIYELHNLCLTSERGHTIKYPKNLVLAFSVELICSRASLVHVLKHAE